MAEATRAAVEIEDFPGLAANIDPLDAPPGMAEVQVNVVAIVPGELAPRAGYREVSFESG